jgi:hypothetical protein
MWTWVYEPCEYFTSLQLLCKTLEMTWYRKFYMCAPLNLQYLEILSSGTNKFTLYMCIYIVAKNRSFLEFEKFLKPFLNYKVPCHIYLYQVQSSPISKVSIVDMFFGMQMLSSLFIVLARTVANLR